jgi:hypothetical protein
MNPFPLSPLALAFSEPDVKHIAPHVFEAHEKAMQQMHKPRGTVVAEITFVPDIEAFELVPQNRDTMNILRALGAGAKVTIAL